ncbi:hypothetical protein RhiirA5_350038 [Rhizophagus irregularis]|uniref:Autophagy-related protein 27 n=3 Tax=Rhizophagus irregularis TaxID=588596 RepID=A0A2N0SAU4_9GLOM|nr:autophagy-related protein 27 [Rhizophagus irregularis DAOM 181602=DAOM 197198]EXX50915.1 hypothetical protein RirG_266400 [Rhizophagus irregularis DAOM 197198w]PKC14697.1 hypothetical protein RhiirA5_350038 [Rhizophagus irregularis]PKC72678.1 hypothetical protein RhiirA1_411469 [Rhizophagus irregularis]POG67417.1 autophagy-related protein 27 [Rhizophagus irregularis DAOM 181602=DAOM 197198]UZO28924.1 hypothetical protein OCT59_022429 [Rhizophagus irregularis]|eukprot:XP_025174283.1 autophagy-related protein 27 [Rhizophagus irregularis DAOM 181602=DAOM 197198]
MSKFISLFLFTILVLGQTSLAYNCSDIVVDRIKFDLSDLNKVEEIIGDVEVTHPTYTRTNYLINPCEPLTYKDDQVDQCENGTYICEIIINYLKDPRDPKESDPKNRTISIKSVAGGDIKESISLGPVLNDVDSHGNLSIILHGGSYKNESQQANITFICSEQNKTANIIGYKENTLFIEWETKAACGERIPEEDKGMGGFTKFILIIIFIVLCYFGIGAAYNYHVYKAHGWDLLPHLDFWRDFPYLVSDFFKYLVNFIRTGRGGYARV